MANTDTQLRYHCIWSTKNREKMIHPGIEKRVWAVITSTADRHGMRVIKAGGIEDHVHVLIEIPKTMAVAEAMKRVKGGSSNAIKHANLVRGHFAWQDGYGAFTVSSSAIGDVGAYIDNQPVHHRTMTYEEEFLLFLEKHDVEYDPKYLWD